MHSFEVAARAHGVRPVADDALRAGSRLEHVHRGCLELALVASGLDLGHLFRLVAVLTVVKVMVVRLLEKSGAPRTRSGLGERE